MNCKECKYYKEPSIHGHGEYFGECTYIYKLSDEIQKNTKKFVIIKDPYQYIRDEKDKCTFLYELEDNKTTNKESDNINEILLNYEINQLKKILEIRKIDIKNIKERLKHLEMLQNKI